MHHQISSKSARSLWAADPGNEPNSTQIRFILFSLADRKKKGGWGAGGGRKKKPQVPTWRREKWNWPQQDPWKGWWCLHHHRHHHRSYCWENDAFAAHPGTQAPLADIPSSSSTLARPARSSPPPSPHHPHPPTCLPCLQPHKTLVSEDRHKAPAPLSLPTLPRPPMFPMFPMLPKCSLSSQLRARGL